MPILKGLSLDERGGMETNPSETRVICAFWGRGQFNFGTHIFSLPFGYFNKLIIFGGTSNFRYDFRSL